MRSPWVALSMHEGYKERQEFPVDTVSECYIGIILESQQRSRVASGDHATLIWGRGTGGEM